MTASLPGSGLPRSPYTVVLVTWRGGGSSVLVRRGTADGWTSVQTGTTHTDEEVQAMDPESSEVLAVPLDVLLAAGSDLAVTGPGSGQ